MSKSTPDPPDACSKERAQTPPSAWYVLRPLPCRRRFSAKATCGPAPGAQVFEPLHLTPDLRAPTGCRSQFSLVLLCLSTLSFCMCSPEVTVTSLHPPRLCRLAVFSIKPTFLAPFSANQRCLAPDVLSGTEPHGGADWRCMHTDVVQTFSLWTRQCLEHM